ncbi:MAG: class I mannose-6-phosphate isomerase [Ilumatobacteraceae bacterium]|nr:class I mannose-6-phosphate isomerase [Ilumatobacteraceae bacterium]
MPRPILLPDNRVPVYYQGGEGIDRFRAVPGERRGPEDWVASLCTLPPRVGATDSGDAGLSVTADGVVLADLIAADPVGWLGEGLAERFGDDSGLLVKLLDAGERLPVHCHPTRTFGADHLGSLFGKTEGWIILDAEPGSRVWLGLSDDIDRATLRRWIDHQDAMSMLAAMNEVEVGAGQVVYVPAGVPHAIGPGILLTELQEPTAFSVLAEHAAFGVGADQATLGLGWDVAIDCFDLSGYGGERLAALFAEPVELAASTGGIVSNLFPTAAEQFFSARLVQCFRDVDLPWPSFAVVVVTGGVGSLCCDAGADPIRRGETWVVPHGVGPASFRGDVEAIVCLPPSTDRTTS